jgi:hypothetical protein
MNSSFEKAPFPYRTENADVLFVGIVSLMRRLIGHASTKWFAKIAEAKTRGKREKTQVTGKPHDKVRSRRADRREVKRRGKRQ